MRCLEKDPARRYQSMDEMLEALRDGHMSAGGHSGIFKRPPGGATTTGPHPSPLFAAVSATGHQRLHPGAGHQRRGARVGGQGAASARRLMGVALAGAAAASSAGRVAPFVFLRPGQAEPVKPPETAEAARGRPGSCRAAHAHARARAGGAPEGALPADERADRRARLLPGARSAARRRSCWRCPAGRDGTVTAELTFALEGYQTETVITGGSGDVVLSQKLQKRRGGGGRNSVAAAPKVEFANGDAAPAWSPPPRWPPRWTPAESLVPSTPAPRLPSSGHLRPAQTPGSGQPCGAAGERCSPRRATELIPYSEGMPRPEQLDGQGHRLYARGARDPGGGAPCW